MTRRSGILPAVFGLLCLVVGGGVPTPVRAQATMPPDSARLMAALAFLASDQLNGRRTGTEGNAEARAFVIEGFEAAGVAPLGERFEHPFEFGSRSGATLQGVNVLGRIPGSETPERQIVVSAHFDHVGVREGEIYNGADDNASGTAALLEVAHALALSPPKNTVVLAAFDAEEMGLRGARAFVAGLRDPAEEIALNVNIDMVSRGGGLLWAGGSFHEPALAPILEAVAQGAPATLRLGHDRPDAPEGADWTNSSDHGAFHRAGIPFVYFGVEDSPHTHRPTDDFESVDPAVYLNNVRTVLLAIRALDAALPLSPEPPVR